MGKLVINFALTGCKIYTIKEVSSAPRWLAFGNWKSTNTGLFPIADRVSRAAAPLHSILVSAQSCWKAIARYGTGARFQFYWTLSGDYILSPSGSAKD